VLRSYPLGEGDRLVSLLSRENGKVRGVARGARLPKSRFGSCLEMLSHIRVWYYERETRDLVRINQCELVESFLDAQSDYYKGVALALVSEVTEFVLQEREPADAQFRLVLISARAIREFGDPWLPLAYFSLWTLRLAGWLPSLEECGRCGARLSIEGRFFAPERGVLLCQDCRMPGSKAASPGAVELAKLVLHRKLAELDPKGPESAAARELSGALLDWIELHVEKKLNSRRMLEEGVELRN